MRILLISGFSTAKIRSKMTLCKRTFFYKCLIKLFNLPNRVGEFRDTAPWIESIVENLKQKDDIELHVMAPHIRMYYSMEEFEMEGVVYHYYRSELSSLLRKINNYKLWKRLQMTSYYTKKILRRVRPDIVVLSGTENPVTSVSFLNCHNYPLYCLCQTIYNNPERAKYGTPNQLIQDMEKDIFANLSYFGVYGKMHYDLLMELKPGAIVFKYGYPSKGTLLEPSVTEKEFDFVNFALMHGSRKGTPDSIRALAIVKKRFPNVSLNIVGGCDEKGRVQLETLVRELGLEDNVIFTPFFEKKSDLLLYIQKSRFAVLPCKLDVISGTMNQAMQLGLPLVVYRTTGTPSFNREKDCVLIAEKGNIEEMAQHMLTLMEHPEKAEMLAKNAREYQEKKAEYSKGNGDRLLANFKAIIENYRYGTPIPEDQLFNPQVED